MMAAQKQLGLLLDNFLEGVKTTKERKAERNKRGITNTAWSAALVQTTSMIQSGEWEDARAVHFVAVYAIMHERVYGIAPEELGPLERQRAAFMASKMVKESFDAEPAKLIDFMRWVWAREKSREEWRRDNGGGGGRIRWQVMFNGALLTDYRLAIARSRSRRGG